MFPLVESTKLDLHRDGAERIARALSKPKLEALLLAVGPHDRGAAGTRLSSIDKLWPWLRPDGPIGRIAAGRLGPEAAPVRVVLFDKNPTSNWALGWHQDRTIAVFERVDVAGFNNWNRKNGIDHVEPPFDILERMLTLRIHLDPVAVDNAPLLVSPGTHRLGKIGEGRIADVVKQQGEAQCLAHAGDIWVYRTPILHASKRAISPQRRRVLQIDFSADELPKPLRWLLK